MNNEIKSLIENHDCPVEFKDVILNVVKIIEKYPSQTHHPDSKATEEIVNYLNGLKDE